MRPCDSVNLITVTHTHTHQGLTWPPVMCVFSDHMTAPSCCCGAVVVSNSRTLFHSSIKCFSLMAATRSCRATPHKDTFIPEKRPAGADRRLDDAATSLPASLSCSEVSCNVILLWGVSLSKQTHSTHEEEGAEEGVPSLSNGITKQGQSYYCSIIQTCYQRGTTTRPAVTHLCWVNISAGPATAAREGNFKQETNDWLLQIFLRLLIQRADKLHGSAESHFCFSAVFSVESRLLLHVQEDAQTADTCPGVGFSEMMGRAGADSARIRATVRVSPHEILHQQPCLRYCSGAFSHITWSSSAGQLSAVNPRTSTSGGK